MTEAKFPDVSVERFHVPGTWAEAKKNQSDSILFVCEDIIAGEIEKAHMAKTMDLLEATVPSERVEQTKRLMEGILKDLKRSIRDRVRRRVIDIH